jgi:hypothetical protein
MSSGFLPALVMIVLLLGSVLSGQPQEPVGTCELLRNIESYNGKLITVRAFIGGGSRHGYYLVDSKVDSRKEIPCPSMPSSKADWPPTIDFVWPGNPVLERNPAPFERDIAAEGKLNEALSKVKQENDSDRMVLATFVGQIRTRPSIKIIYDKAENGYFGTGYGYFGRHPAQLVVSTVLNITIE